MTDPVRNPSAKTVRSAQIFSHILRITTDRQ